MIDLIRLELKEAESMVTNRVTQPPVNVGNSLVRKNFLGALICGQWLDAVIILLTLASFFSTFILLTRPVIQMNEAVRWSIAGMTSLLALVFVFYFSKALSRLMAKLVRRVGDLPLWWYLILGLVLRILWNVAFPSVPGSDGGTYLAIAIRLLEEGEYFVGGMRAYWPPGYPLFLALWYSIFPSFLAFHLANLVLFVCCFYGVVFLVRLFGDDCASRTAGLLIAIWPNLVSCTGVPEKELLVLALLPWVVFFLIRSMIAEYFRWLESLAVGVILGVCALVQPSLQLLLLLVIIFLLTAKGLFNRRLSLAILVLLGFAVVIAPWSFRNYLIFNQFVLVSTNGGSNLYRANNPNATGGYIARGEVDLSHLGEIEQDREGKKLAIKWIQENPAPFGRLIIEKQIRFMGDDAYGVYSVFKVGGASKNENLYIFLKLISNIWWLAVWALLAVAVFEMVKNRNQILNIERFLLWPWLYLFFLHSVFESSGKYHVPMLWVICALLPLYYTCTIKKLDIIVM